MEELFNEINEGFCFHTLRETNTMPDSTACGNILIAFEVKSENLYLCLQAIGKRTRARNKPIKRTGNPARILYSHTSFNLVFQSADCNEPITNAEDRCLFVFLSDFPHSFSENAIHYRYFPPNCLL